MPDALGEIEEFKRKIALYEAVLELLDVGVHVIDTNRLTLLYNKTMARMEGEDASQMLGRPFMSGNNYFQDEDSTLLKVLRTGEVVADYNQRYWNSRGQPVITLNSTRPLMIDGLMIGALETASNVTHIQRLAEKIMDLHETSSKRNKKIKFNGACKETRYTFESIIGRSAAINQALSHARKIAQNSSNVLIYGETGTGKELFAQSIHAASDRRDRPFIDVNCAALPSQLLEGLLFGSVKGGFTDAQDRPGLFEQADGGTLLLDEINSMHPDLQGKLLRALQEKRIRRLGSVSSTMVDVRVISTTNIKPKAAIERKELREDLFYRLNVANISLPPLRKRQEDIPEYVGFFIKKYASKLGLKVSSCSPRVASLFQHHPWPGNVRQLEHVIEGALNLVSPNDEALMTEHLPMLFHADDDDYPSAALYDPAAENISPAPPDSGAGLEPPSALAAGGAGGVKLLNEKQLLERRLVEEALRRNGNNISQTARQLGITRQLLQYKIKKYASSSLKP